MNLNKWFEKGLSEENYRETLEDHKDNFQQIDQSFSLPIDQTFFEKIKSKNLRILVLAEPWCGHCMLNIPILLKMTKAMDMDVRFLLRDENLELMDQYLTNGNRTIPIVIFINDQGEEVGTWGPVADTTRQFLAPYLEKMPPKDTDGYDEAFKEIIKLTTKQFRENTDLWNGVYDSIKQTLQKITSS